MDELYFVDIGAATRAKTLRRWSLAKYLLHKHVVNHEVAMKWREDPDLKTKHKMKTVTLSIKAGM